MSPQASLSLEDLIRIIVRDEIRALQPDDGFLDVDGAAVFLGGCSRKRIYALVERGRIRSRKLGGRLLFDPAELRADVERGE